jgi:hypothetical protein
MRAPSGATDGHATLLSAHVGMTVSGRRHVSKVPEPEVVFSPRRHAAELLQ